VEGKNMINLIISGTPIAKKRPRFVRRGNFVGTYNPQETEEGRFLFEIQKQWKEKPLEGPINLKVYFFLPIPKGTSRIKTVKMINGIIKHTKRPDCDNLIKFVKDCLNTVVWKDDSQIFLINAEKIYSTEPRTSIFIEEQ
jgi:Holliday junction resolvase RusA-like endonuclease